MRLTADLFALSDVPLGSYVLGNAVGFIPGTLIFSSLGHQARQLHGLVFYTAEHTDEEWRYICAEMTVTLTAVIALGAYFRKTWAEEQERFSGTKSSPGEVQ